MPPCLARPTRALLGCCLALALAGCEPRGYREVAIDLDHGAAPAAVSVPGQSRPLRFCLSPMESPSDTYDRYRSLLLRVAEKFGTGVELVQRRTDAEVIDLLITGQLDLALLGPGALLELRRRAPGAVEAVAVPVVRGASTYHSLLIVPAAGPVHALVGLAGRRFAFTDELSISGHRWIVKRLRDLGRDPDQFFGEVTYTHSHTRSIEGVADGLVDGAAVASAVYERALKRRPALAMHVRVLERSPPLGMQAVVASTRLGAAERARLAEVFIGLDDDPASAPALRPLQIDEFIRPPPGLEDSPTRLLEGAP